MDAEGRLQADCRRHLRDCLHFYRIIDPADDTPDRDRAADRVSYVREANDEEMGTVRACQTCAPGLGNSSDAPPVCPVCFTALSANGTCLCDPL
jgi:hypothetical protein